MGSQTNASSAASCLLTSVTTIRSSPGASVATRSGPPGGIPANHKVLLRWPAASKQQAARSGCPTHFRWRNDVTISLRQRTRRSLTTGHGTSPRARRCRVRGLRAAAPPGECYCAADVYVHCSDNEPHSLAITEAIYCGLPVVLSDRCGSYGPTDDVQPGINGFVYRCGDVATCRVAS